MQKHDGSFVKIRVDSCRFVILLFCTLFAPLSHAEPILKPGDLVAICGDSITEQKYYSVWIEDYLLMCQPVKNVSVMQFGWSGERADTLLRRMENDVLRFKPTVATICYGMNDGRYQPFNERNARIYRDAMDRVVETFQKNGVRVVVGSPGPVDVVKFKHNKQTPEIYNKTLAAFTLIAQQTAEAHRAPFADIYHPLYDVMTKAKAKWGETFPIWDKIGIHPHPDGQLVMAYAFLKAMGMDGQIGTITIDLAGKTASATDGHAVKSFDSGIVTVESTRYPFCFVPDGTEWEDKTPYSVRGVAELFPFNDELNRFMLVIKGAKGDVKITWGEETRTFSADQVAKGINLAAEFIDNPFSEPFAKVHAAVVAQQEYETPMIKGLVTAVPHYPMSPPAAEATQRTIEFATKEDAALRAAAVKAVVPVTHTIRIEQ